MFWKKIGDQTQLGLGLNIFANGETQLPKTEKKKNKPKPRRMLHVGRKECLWACQTPSGSAGTTLGTALEDEPGQCGDGGRECFQLPDVFCLTA